MIYILVRRHHIYHCQHNILFRVRWLYLSSTDRRIWLQKSKLKLLFHISLRIPSTLRTCLPINSNIFLFHVFLHFSTLLRIFHHFAYNYILLIHFFSRLPNFQRIYLNSDSCRCLFHFYAHSIIGLSRFLRQHISMFHIRPYNLISNRLSIYLGLGKCLFLFQNVKYFLFRRYIHFHLDNLQVNNFNY